MKNNYFFSAVASILENSPVLITRLFENSQNNDRGIYNIWLSLNGEWKNVFVDDFFPVYFDFDTNSHKLAFS